jgi:hypothetical protein
MKYSNADIQHGIMLLSYIIKKLGGEGDFLRIFKILYFADQKHLATYGRTISNDRYVAMKNGPVPSLLYDLVKYLRGDGFLVSQEIPMNRYFDLLGKSTLKLKESADYDLLSESDMEAIDQSIQENKFLDFNSLSNKSHDTAWNNANFNDDMDLFEIARAGGANEDMIDYIKESVEIQNLFQCH